MALLVDLSRERGLTLVVSIHDIDLAREFFPRLVGLRQGRVVFDNRTSGVSESELTRLFTIEGLERVERGPR